MRGSSSHHMSLWPKESIWGKVWIQRCLWTWSSLKLKWSTVILHWHNRWCIFLQLISYAVRRLQRVRGNPWCFSATISSPRGWAAFHHRLWPLGDYQSGRVQQKAFLTYFRTLEFDRSLTVTHESLAWAAVWCRWTWPLSLAAVKAGSQNLRMVWTGTDLLNATSFQTPCLAQGHPSPDQLTQCSAQPGLECSQG